MDAFHTIQSLKYWMIYHTLMPDYMIIAFLVGLSLAGAIIVSDWLGLFSDAQ